MGQVVTPHNLMIAYCNMMIDSRYKVYSRTLEYFGKYESKLDPKLKIELGLFGLTIGSVGFVVSTTFDFNMNIDLHVWTSKCDLHVSLLLRLIPHYGISLPKSEERWSYILPS